MNGSPERRFLLEAVRLYLGSQRLLSMDPAALNWHVVLDAARSHRVEPILHAVANQAPWAAAIPEDVRTSLKLTYHGTALKNEFIARRLELILAQAHRRNLKVMVLKGAVLAFWTYENPGLRPMDDVDLLVDEGDFANMRQVLEQCGYRTTVPDLAPGELALYSHCAEQIRFWAATVPLVEVHFRVLNLGIPSKIEPAWHDSAPYVLRKERAWCPCPERFLLHLCLHAAQHQFALLRLLLDVAVWQRSHVLDEENLEALAREHHLSSVTFYALAYCSHLLGVSQFPRLMSRLRPPAWRRRLLEQVWDDRRIRALSKNPGAMALELPRTYLLSEAPFTEKSLFLRTVMFPPKTWLAPSRAQGLRHWKRLLVKARAGREPS